MLEVTTQKGVRSVTHPIERRFNTTQPRIQKKRIEGTFYSNSAFFTCKSIRGERAAQIPTDGKGFGRFWPMRSKADANNGLQYFIQEVGIPEHLIVDGLMEQGAGQQGTDWRRSLRSYHIRQTTTEPYSPWQNRAKGEVRRVK
jgi:hypothetical protein